MKVTTSTEINVDSDICFKAFTDFEKLAQILHYAYDVNFQSPNKEGVGATWIQKAGDHEDPTVTTHVVTELIPNQSFTMTSEDNASLETMQFAFNPSENGTLVTFSMSAKTKGALLFFVAPFLKRSVELAMHRDLNQMKEYIEKTFA